MGIFFVGLPSPQTQNPSELPRGQPIERSQLVVALQSVLSSEVGMSTLYVRQIHPGRPIDAINEINLSQYHAVIHGGGLCVHKRTDAVACGTVAGVMQCYRRAIPGERW